MRNIFAVRLIKMQRRLPKPSILLHGMFANGGCGSEREQGVGVRCSSNVGRSRHATLVASPGSIVRVCEVKHADRLHFFLTGTVLTRFSAFC
jgi:hypothetical protein